MRLECISLIACPVERLARELEHPALFHYVTAPMLTFVPVDPPEFPDPWRPGKYRARLLVGGRLPIGDHTLDVRDDVSGDVVWHDAGYSGLIKLWDHKIVLEDAYGMTRYRDVVEIHAGPLTLPAWLFAKAFYSHRQRRLNRLTTADFDDARLG
jgi:hypothetical protein